MKGLVSDTNLTAIGNAIRDKTGKTAKIKVADMAEEIKGIAPKFIIKIDGESRLAWKIVSSNIQPTDDVDVWVKGE